MASLPSQHPSLAIHMTDRATTPLISSASSTSPSQAQKQQPQFSKQQRKPQITTFSTSPPSTPSDQSDDDDDDTDDTDSSVPLSPASRQARALTSLSATALLSYDAAKRLGRGAPLRTMVEYPDGGPVVLHSYMCPMGLALGVPGRNTSNTSLHTAAGAAGGSPPGSVNGGGGAGHDDDGVDTGGGGVVVASDAATPRAEIGRRTPTTRPLSFALDPAGDDGGGGGDTEGIDPSDPPMLTSTVVAPRTEDLREARRATARLEKVARVFQAEWVATGRR